MKNFIILILSFIPDKLYLSLRYFLVFKKWLNWNNPQTFSEKLQWLKLYDRNPNYTQMVDKYEVKKYVENRIGGGIWYQHLVFGINQKI